MRACSVAACVKPNRARGLCSTHYNQAHQPQRHRKITVPCDHCGEPCEKVRTGRYAARFCSLVCRDSTRRASCPVPDTHPSRSTRVPADHLSRWNGRALSCRVFVRDCAVCGRCFASRYTITTCGWRCAREKRLSDKRDHRHRYRARLHGAFAAPVVRHEIFRRDNWCCRLCGDPLWTGVGPTHPMAPTIDHIVPLSRGGTHEPGNCQAAHFTCNSAKGARHAA